MRGDLCARPPALQGPGRGRGRQAHPRSFGISAPLGFQSPELSSCPILTYCALTGQTFLRRPNVKRKDLNFLLSSKHECDGVRFFPMDC